MYPASESLRNGKANSTAVSAPKLLYLDPLQPSDTGPDRLTDLDRQFAAFKSLVNKPQAHHEFFSVERCLLCGVLLRLTSNDKIPYGLKLT